MSSPAHPAAEAEQPILVWLDPRELIVGPNVRLDPRLDAEFIDSIASRGVLEPIVAYRAEEGIVVDRGSRRTAAAIASQLVRVPVLLWPRPPADPDRVVDQLVENVHRAALTNREVVAAVDQLALFGLSPAQIAGMTAMPREEVKAAVRVATSPAAAAHADELTLADAALVAEFEGDDAAVAALLDEAGRGGHLEFRAKRIREDRAEEAAIAARAVQLGELGLTVIPKPSYNSTTVAPLDQLRKPNGRTIKEAAHVDTCPGHVVWVTRTYSRQPTEDEPIPLEVVAGCSGWAGHGHRHVHGVDGAPAATAQADVGEEERERARLQRRHVIVSNKDWAAATELRREWLLGFFRRKTAPAGAEVFVAAAMDRGQVHTYEARGLLGVEPGLTYAKGVFGGVLATAGAKRALQIALCLAIASWEADTTSDSWRAQPETAAVNAEVLQALAGWGYRLTPIEERVVAGTAAQPIAEEVPGGGE